MTIGVGGDIGEQPKRSRRRWIGRENLSTDPLRVGQPTGCTMLRRQLERLLDGDRHARAPRNEMKPGKAPKPDPA